MPLAATKAKPKKPSGRRETVFPELKAVLYSGENSLTIAEAKELLGWVEQPDDVSWGSDHVDAIFKLIGKKVRCLNNLINRPIILSALKKYIQDILTGKWATNLDSIVIGKTGQIMSGQHRLIALIVAEIMRLKFPDKWAKIHPNELVMTCVIGFGVEESDAVFRTLNSGATASLADTMYRSTFMSSVPMETRMRTAKTLQRAVGTLWSRLGYSTDDWAAVRTVSEAHDFIERHPSLLECALHIHKEGDDRRFSSLKVPPGALAALMYLMAVSGAEYEGYHHARVTGKAFEKKHLNLKNWEAAEAFMTLLLDLDDETMQPVRDALEEMHTNGDDMVIKTQLLVHAWNLYCDGSEITPLSVKLELAPVNIFGKQPIGKNYTCGGVDNGIEVRDFGEEGEEEDLSSEEEEETVPVIKPKKWKRTRDDIEALREKYPEHLLVYNDATVCTLFGEHAFEASPILVIDCVDTPSKLKELAFPCEDMVTHCTALVECGKKLMVVNADDHEDCTEFTVDPLRHSRGKSGPRKRPVVR